MASYELSKEGATIRIRDQFDNVIAAGNTGSNVPNYNIETKYDSSSGKFYLLAITYTGSYDKNTNTYSGGSVNTNIIVLTIPPFTTFFPNHGDSFFNGTLVSDPSPLPQAVAIDNTNTFSPPTYDYTIGTTLYFKQEANVARLVTLADFCIHEDMIVDEVGLPISKIKEYPDSRFKKLLHLGSTDNFINIKKNSLGNGLPTEDLLLTPGHPIIHNGEEKIALELVNDDSICAVKLDKKVSIYGLMFDERISIKMHGVDVVQWEKEEYADLSSKRLNN